MLRNSEQLYQGMDVYDANHQKIGTVDEILDAAADTASASGGGYVRVPTGFLGMGREHHIPFSAIRSVEGERVYVNFPKHHLDELGYGEAPTFMDQRIDSDRRPDRLEASRHLRLREEELVARKQSVETGRVRLGKEIVSEERTLEVPVTREEVTIERRPIERRPSDKPIEEAGRTIEVPVRAERIEIEKQPVVYEEVGVRKNQVTQTERVSGTVRREEARINRARGRECPQRSWYVRNLGAGYAASSRALADALRERCKPLGGRRAGVPLRARAAQPAGVSWPPLGRAGARVPPRLGGPVPERPAGSRS